MTKLASTPTAQISLSFLVMSLELALRRLFLRLFIPTARSTPNRFLRPSALTHRQPSHHFPQPCPALARSVFSHLPVVD